MPIDADLLSLYDRAVRREIEPPDMRREVLPHLVRLLRPAPGGVRVVYSRLDPAQADDQIRTEIAYFTALGQPYEWQVCGHDEPADLKARLIAHGFKPDDDPAVVMVLDLSRPPAWPRVDADVRRLTSPEQLSDVVRVMEAVWGGDFGWMYARLGGHLQIPGYLSLYAAYVDGQPACAGWTYFQPGSHFAGLWGGSTLPEHRHRGLYTAVLAARAQEAAQRGYPYLMVEAGSMSRPIVAKHGFEPLTTIEGLEGPTSV